MITTLRPVLRAALRHGYAVGAFNVSNLEVTQAVLAAADAQRSPVIVGISESAWNYGGVGLLAAIRALAETTRVPVVIHLDHGHDLDRIRLALDSGFTSVMIDASALPYKRNLTETKKIVKIAHAKRISVEAELGTIGGQEDTTSAAHIIYPTPKEVADFVRATGVDAIAVGLGTSHGLPVPHEHIEYELLTQIHEIVRIPVVLHGASNLPPATLRAAIRRGISKINIDTEVRQTYTAALRSALAGDTNEFDLRTYTGSARSAVMLHVQTVMRTFGSVNHAHDAGTRRW